MNKHRKPMGIYLFPVLIATVAATVLRTVALFTEFNVKNGHFDDKALILSANTVMLVFALFAFTYVFFGARQNLKATFATPSTYVPSGLVAICLLFLAATLIGYGMKAPEGAVLYQNLQYPLAYITALLAIPSVIHFFLNAYFTDVKNETRAFFSLFTVLLLGFYASFLYFTKDLPLNAPNKTVDQMAFLFSALFFLYEARISLGREVWRGYIAFGMIGAMLCAYSSLPSLIFYVFKSERISSSVEENLLLAAIFIFISLRLCLTATLRGTEDDGGISALEGYANERQAHVAEEEKIYKDAFAIQMTIDDLGAYEPEAPADGEIPEEAEEQPAVEEQEEDGAENLSFDFDIDTDNASDEVQNSANE